MKTICLDRIKYDVDDKVFDQLNHQANEIIEQDGLITLQNTKLEQQAEQIERLEAKGTDLCHQNGNLLLENKRLKEVVKDLQGTLNEWRLMDDD